MNRPTYTEEVERWRLKYPHWTTWQCELAADESWSRFATMTWTPEESAEHARLLSECMARNSPAGREAQLAEIMRLVADYGAEYDPSFGHEDTFTRDAYAAVEAAVRKALGL